MKVTDSSIAQSSLFPRVYDSEKKKYCVRFKDKN